MRLIVGLLVVLAQANPTWRSWNQPVEPFRIADNLYYVGASDIAAYLVTTPDGHILIDGGFEETVPIIAANVKTLGFALEDVRILLNSHAHVDHAAGLAALRTMTGAAFHAMEGDVPVLATGKDELGAEWPAIRADRVLRDGDTVSLGGMTLTARNTAGHTRGNTTWVIPVTDRGRRYTAVIVGSMSVLDDTRLTGDPAWPDRGAAYARSIDTLRSLDCEIFLGAHAQFFHRERKHAALKAEPSTNPFVDPAGCTAWIDRAAAAIEKRR